MPSLVGGARVRLLGAQVAGSAREVARGTFQSD